VFTRVLLIINTKDLKICTPTLKEKLWYDLNHN
jgi:hypothetical protein